MFFGKNEKKNVNAESANSRYSFETMDAAYNNIRYHGDIAVLTIPVNNPETSDVEMYFNAPKEEVDPLIGDFFRVLPKIDAIVQDDDIGNYDIAYLHIYDGKVEIGYWGNKENTQFDVELFRKDGQWHLSQIGTKKFNPPKFV